MAETVEAVVRRNRPGTKAEVSIEYVRILMLIVWVRYCIHDA